MYTVTAAILQVVSVGEMLALLMAAVIGLVFSGWSALIGLGFLKRKIIHHVIGSDPFAGFDDVEDRKQRMKAWKNVKIT